MPNNSSHSTAINSLISNIPTCSPNDTVKDLIVKIRTLSPKFESISYIYVLNARKNLIGVVAIKSIFKALDTQKIQEIMTKDIVSVSPSTDQEKAAILAIKYNIKALPVIDKNNVFLGIIPTDKILNILHDEHVEDILKLSGIDVSVLKKSEKEHSRTSLSLRMRLPWLIIGAFGSLILSWIVSKFDYTIEKLIYISFFIPIVSYMSGAIANQTLSMLIRNILIKKLKISTYLFSEMITGTVLGTIFGLLIGCISFLWLKSYEIFIILVLSLPVNALISVFISSIFPWILLKYNKDPAYAAGPFSIIIQDAISIFFYFFIASLVLQFY